MSVSIEIKGRINEAGRLEIDLPEGLPPGAVTVKIEMLEVDESAWEAVPWTEEEIAEMLTFQALPAEQIAASDAVGAWKDLGITDGQAWVEEARRNRRERRGW
jgi:hypothetical protein